MSATDDLVTVLVPAKNEEQSIGECLRSILSQDHVELEVIVLVEDSRDATAEIVWEIAQRDPRVVLVRHRLDGIPRSLNLGLARARGRWLVRVDAHSRIAPGYVRTVVGHLRSGEWGGVGGRKDGTASTPAGRAIAQALGSRFGVGNSRYHYGTERDTVDHIPFGAYPTALLRTLGGWNESLQTNEDFELDYRIRRLGRRLLFDPSARIFWNARESIPDLFRQYRRYGRGKADVARLHPDSLELRHLAAPGLVLVLIGASLAASRRPAVAMTVVSPYIAGLGGASVNIALRGRDLRAAPWLPLAFLAMHLGWGLGFWEGLVKPVRRTKPRSVHTTVTDLRAA
jgi:cellulose synthase/poly-beta-1,6-N-acetylglucosamine synthase-like glycosyltransferase